MKVVTKTVARKLKQAREKEKKGNQEKMGKKTHRNFGEILAVEEVGQNQTFNMLHGGAVGDADNAARKHQIKVKQEQIKQAKQKRKQEKKQLKFEHDLTR